MSKHILKKQDKTQNQTRGFTIFETIVGFTLLTMVMAGFATTVVTSLRAFRQAEEKYVAAKIAQEGIELMINKSANNQICLSTGTCSLSDWRDNIIGSFEVDSGRPQDLLPDKSFKPFDGSDYVCTIAHGTDQGKFGYCGSSDSLSPKYTREVVTHTFVSNDAAIDIQSIVRWNGGKSLILEEVKFKSN